MALPSSGPISMQMINVELARPATQIISLNDSAVRALAQVPSGTISLSNFYGKSAVVNEGFWFCGYDAAVNLQNISNKISFATEAFSANPTMPAARFKPIGAANNTDIFFINGATTAFYPGAISLAFQDVQKFNFGTATYATAGSNPQPTGLATWSQGAAVSDSNIAYWSNQGNISSPLGVFENRKLNLSTLVQTSIGPANTPVLRYERSAKNNPTHGYWLGGYRAPPATRGVEISKMPFSTEVMATISNMPIGTAQFGMAASPTTVYAATQDIPATNVTSYKILFSTDAVSTFSMFQSRRSATAVNTQSVAYFKGGQNPAPAGGNRLNYMKLTFSNDSTAAIGSLPTANSAQISGQSRSIGW